MIINPKALARGAFRAPGVRSGGFRKNQMFAIKKLGVPLLAAAAVLLGAGSAAAEPAMWIVEDEDSTIYLYGTVHLLREGVTWDTPKLRQAMAGSSQTWFEIAEVDASSNPEAQAQTAVLMQSLGVDPARGLSVTIGESLQRKLDEVAERYGMTAAQFEPLEPWLVALTFSLVPLQAAGYAQDKGVDPQLKAIAVGEGDRIGALETTEQQLRFFDSLEPDLQLAFLEQTLDDAERIVPIMDELATAWAAGQPDRIAEILNAEMKVRSPRLYDRLLTQRNAAWSEQIRTLLAGSGTHFIAVGAGHLAGPDSVQAHLEALGVAVRPY